MRSKHTLTVPAIVIFSLSLALSYSCSATRKMNTQNQKQQTGVATDKFSDADSAAMRVGVDTFPRHQPPVIVPHTWREEIEKLHREQEKLHEAQAKVRGKQSEE
jgi:hypothetical protein